MLNWLC